MDNKDEQDYKFIVTYHPNGQQLPSRTIQLIFKNKKDIPETYVIETFLQCIKDYGNTLKKYKKDNHITTVKPPTKYEKAVPSNEPDYRSLYESFYD